ncbi:MAG: glycosyltransferase family 4 protein [Pseudomonadota bacterium]
MTIAIVLPRNMHFGPEKATSIDLVVHDAVKNSRFRDEIVVVCQETGTLFDGISIRTYRGGSGRARVGQISEILHELKPRLIVAHQHLPTANALARRFRATPVLLHKHNFIECDGLFRRFRRSLQLNRLAGVVFVSEACRASFVDGFPGFRHQSFVAHNGLPLGDWPVGPEKAQEIVAVGRIEGRKGQIEIAQALRCILPQHPSWRARFIGAIDGDAAFSTAFIELVDDAPQIEWSGPKPFDEVVAATRRASIAVVNSSKEAFGRVAIEAFAAETALVSSRVGGLAEVIGNAALVLERRDPTEIAEKVQTLINDEALRKRLAEEGRARFEANFTPQRTAADLDAAYEAVL